MLFIDGSEVRARLTYDLCIPVVRQAMAAFSRGETKQLLRSVLPLGGGRMFGVMPGALGEGGVFGAKLVSVFHDAAAGGGPSHKGVVVLFDGQDGAPICIVDGGEITAIRTAAASAVATDALARQDATQLTILGSGVQALAHARALVKVRAFSKIVIWARSSQKAEALAQGLSDELGMEVIALPSVEGAVADADVICTVTASSAPILESLWVPQGAHLNVVGSSIAGPSEIDSALVARARFIADSREGVLAQGAEFLLAKAAALVTDQHVAGEIGQVLNGEIEGRQSPEQVTLYKSLGHIVQDLAAAQALYRARRAREA
jgi:ornithine cyclodeaminase/alanine dehydrogenase-like protein (mu-crystallin family)